MTATRKRTRADAVAPDAVSRPHNEAERPSGHKAKSVAVRVTERQFSRQIEDAMRLFGWQWFHVFLSVRSPAGFPDYLACHAEQRRTIAIEIKGTHGKLSPAQKDWIGLLDWCGIPAYAFWPQDIEEAVAVLRGTGREEETHE